MSSQLVSWSFIHDLWKISVLVLLLVSWKLACLENLWWYARSSAFIWRLLWMLLLCKRFLLKVIDCHSRQHLHASVGMHLKEEQMIGAKWYPFAFIRWQSRLLPKCVGGRNWKLCPFNLPMTSLFVPYWLLGGYNLLLLNGSLLLKGGGRNLGYSFLSFFTLLFLSQSPLVKGGGRDLG